MDKRVTIPREVLLGLLRLTGVQVLHQRVGGVCVPGCPACELEEDLDYEGRVKREAALLA